MTTPFAQLYRSQGLSGKGASRLAPGSNTAAHKRASRSQAGYEGVDTCRAARNLPRLGWRLVCGGRGKTLPL